jgi:hypothetical protein
LSSIVRLDIAAGALPFGPPPSKSKSLVSVSSVTTYA